METCGTNVFPPFLYSTENDLRCGGLPVCADGGSALQVTPPIKYKLPISAVPYSKIFVRFVLFSCLFVPFRFRRHIIHVRSGRLTNGPPAGGQRTAFVNIHAGDITSGLFHGPAENGSFPSATAAGTEHLTAFGQPINTTRRAAECQTARHHLCGMSDNRLRAFDDRIRAGRANTLLSSSLHCRPRTAISF